MLTASKNKIGVLLADAPLISADRYPPRSEASTAASRALFILACARPMVADVLRWSDGLGPCTMLLTAGPGAETTLWACTLLGLLADGNHDVQCGIAKVSKPAPATIASTSISLFPA